MSVTSDQQQAAVGEAGSERTSVSIDDKYTLEAGRAFMTGIQALVRLPLEQRRRDVANGIDSAGFISGYRGSPLGAYDQQLWRAAQHLEAHKVKFQPAVNEELAATACWGTQQVGLHAPGKQDGVFSIWYGKGPGVDRSGDAFRHANFAGTTPHGGCLAILGDDHICESSTTAHQSEFAMVDAMIPVLNPAGVQEILDFGLLGFALSRYAGTWVALKCVHDTVESSASVELDPARVQSVIPVDFTLPEDGLNIRWPDHPLEQEARLHDYKHDAVRAFARANALDRVVLDSPSARLGIATTGKSYLDVRQALDDLGITEATAAAHGVRLYKVGLAYPLEPDGARAFAAGLDTIIVVEEKRALIEVQLREVLYGSANTPTVIGKRDEHDTTLFRAAANLDPNYIAAVIGRRLPNLQSVAGTDARLAEVEARLAAPALPAPAMLRTPYFCSGCPHNTSTRVPEGSRALAGIGCHYMAQWMDRDTNGYTQMGGEGASWVGEAPFSKTEHVFQNIGDGTYYHSGLLAIRYAITAKVNVTYKILFNDAVAMTGGQPMDGPLTVPAISQQVSGEGAKQVVVVTDEPEKYASDAGFAKDVTVRHRDDLDAVQRELREVKGCTVIIYDQTCASEKRRRRKRGTFPDPDARAFINSLVCEGCGDCGVQSNCVAIAPKETAFGRKRAIDQSACNKDFSCVRGFCPSFVTVRGGKLRKADSAGSDAALFDTSDMPEPSLPGPERSDQPYNVVVTGVGGTGVVTIGALIGMAAHIEGKGVSVLDMLGLAQKGGSVVSHVRIANAPEAITSTRVADGGADLLLGGDLVVTASTAALGATRPGHTRVVVNLNESMTGDFTRNADAVFPGDRLRESIEARVGMTQTDAVAASRLATALLGDSIGANLFLLGFAWQRGTLPLQRASIEQAIVLNGVAVDMNQRAFALGRRAAVDLAAVQQAASPVTLVAAPAAPPSLAAMVADRRAFLADYQDEAYAGRYAALVDKVSAAEQAAMGTQTVAQAVARYYFKVLAYKDEYEVARLHSGDAFRKELEATFEGNYTLDYHLAPPLIDLFRRGDSEPRKRVFGGWMLRVFELLAKGKRLRGTPWDVFGYTAERRAERAAVAQYEADVAMLLAELAPARQELAVAIASLPEQVRGFGHVKAAHASAARQRREDLLAEWRRAGDIREAA